MSMALYVHCVGFNASIQQVRFGATSFGNAQVTRKQQNQGDRDWSKVVMWLSCFHSCTESSLISMFTSAYFTEAGRTDVVSITKDFILTPNRTFAFESFNIVDDDVLEFDELFIAKFQFGIDIPNNWNTKKGMPSTTLIRIIDNDCQLFSKLNLHRSVPVLHISDISPFPMQLWR